ncbi:alternative ribosome rescue aminoacyl-tRNA hydrolase ArfB [Salinimonas sediminis]|uniref:Aminoacyl-tRNA hydrolase n=1 Tax=Salinimonas sediminis TaxID=2303538 RepID=A0A346NHH7_9ALTE|nr:alternative ribosome rescue aminoacyl-tRNA hydrolase ArfB [Salinimonas sediminis]AXR04984.1 aminoacyl-tRNA hydrolase [Salinimonas sediminis]
MISISPSLRLDDSEVEMSAVRSQGAGGQNVNKVNTAIHLRFNIAASSLPENIKQRLFDKKDNRVSTEGVFILKAQNYRTQEQNRLDAENRLAQWIASALVEKKKRKPTRISKGAKLRRQDAKKQQSQRKEMRKKIV